MSNEVEAEQNTVCQSSYDLYACAVAGNKTKYYHTSFEYTDKLRIPKLGAVAIKCTVQSLDSGHSSVLTTSPASIFLIPGWVTIFPPIVTVVCAVATKMTLVCCSPICHAPRAKRRTPHHTGVTASGNFLRGVFHLRVQPGDSFPALVRHVLPQFVLQLRPRRHHAVHVLARGTAWHGAKVWRQQRAGQHRAGE